MTDYQTNNQILEAYQKVRKSVNPNHHRAEESKDIREIIENVKSSFTLDNVVMFIPVVRCKNRNNEIIGLLYPPKGNANVRFGEMHMTNHGIFNLAPSDVKDVMMGNADLGTPATTKEQSDGLLDAYTNALGDADEIICTLKIVFPNTNPEVNAITYDWASQTEY